MNQDRLKSLNFPSVLLRKRLEYQTKNLGPHKYGCLMGLFPAELCKEITDWTLENIPDYYLSPEGREGQIHTTFLYGFLQSLDEVREPLNQLLREFGPVDIKFADKLSLFKGNKDGDVLKIGIEGEKIHELNRLLKGRFPHKETHPTFIPHITLAYLDPELGISDKCAAYTPPFLGKVVQIITAQYSDAENNREDIPLISHPNTGIKSVPKDDDGKWVTINGTHVHLDGSGNIDKGPKGVTGKKPKASKVKKSKLSEKKQSDIKKKVAEKLEQHEEKTEYTDPNTTLPDDARPNLSESQKNAIKNYTGGHFRPLNEALRLGQPLEGEYEEMNRELQLVFDKIKPFKELVKVYRGMDLRGSFPPKKKAFLAMLEESKNNKGKAISLSNYSSTTTNEVTAKDAFPGDFKFEIEATHGLDVKSFSIHPGEDEMLLDHRSLYQVEDINWNEYAFRWDVKLKQLPPKGK